MKDGLFTQNPEYHDGGIKTYTVTVTGTWNITMKASSAEEAEQLAYEDCLESGIDIEVMNLEFEAFDEEEV